MSVLQRLLDNDPSLVRFVLDLNRGQLNKPLHIKVIEALKTNTTVKSLAIRASNQQLDDELFVNLVDALAVNVSIETLTIAHARLEDRHVIPLARMLAATNSVLKKLDVSHNQFTAAGANALAAMLRSNTTLTHLNASSDSIGSAGAVFLLRALRTLLSLDLRVDALIDNLEAQREIAEMIRVNQTLSYLNIWIPQSAQGIAMLANAISTNGMLVITNDNEWNDIMVSTSDEQVHNQVSRLQRYCQRNKEAHARAKEAVMEVLLYGNVPVDQLVAEAATDDVLTLLKRTERLFKNDAFVKIAKAIWNSRGESIWWDMEPDVKRARTNACIQCIGQDARHVEERNAARAFCGAYCQFLYYCKPK